MEWNKSIDKLPESEGLYIVYTSSADADSPFVYVAWFNVIRERWELIPPVWAEAITHWMRLPEPPEAS